MKIQANLVFFSLSCVAGVMLGIKEVAKIEGLPSYKKLPLIVNFTVGIGFAYFMGRLNGGLFSVVSNNFNWKAFTYSGLISFGLILGGLLYGFLISKISKTSTIKTLDLIALIFPLAESIYRIGCMLMGCCFGRETTGFWGIYLPEIHGVWAYRYPTQILLMIFNLLLFLWLWRRSKKEIKDGSQIIYFMLIYHMGRFLIDFLRGDMPMVGAFGYHQVVSIVIFGMTLLVYILLRKTNRIYGN